jgi:hypothetical protein
MIRDVTFEKMSGSLGSLLLLWAAIERSARKELAGLSSGTVPKPVHGITAVLRDWEKAVIAMQPADSLAAMLTSTLLTQLLDDIKTRNSLCHGLTGISAAQGQAPAALTWEKNGEEGGVSWPVLQASLSRLSRIPNAISMISRPTSQGVRSRMEDNVENRAWWLAEYDLNLAKADGILKP